MNPALRKKIMDILLSVLLIYACLMLLIYVNQRNLIYVPEKVSPAPSLYGVPEMNPMRVHTDDGLDLEGWYAPPAAADKPVILFFQGNAGNKGIRAFKAKFFMQRDYGFLLASYRGYDGDPGEPSEQGLYKDARAYIAWLKAQGVPLSRIVLYGESLGTGVVVQMATEFPDIRGIILECPYTSMAAVTQKHMPLVPIYFIVRDRFSSIRKIGSVRAPVLILHGKLDMIVPFSMGKRLFEAAPNPKTMEVFPLGGHNDLYSYGAGEKILLFLEKFPEK